MASKPKAYSYVRFSSAPQQKGDSLRRQKELSLRYAEANGLEIDETLHLQDLGVSAFDGANVERGALGAFLVAVKEGRIPKGSYLLVESLDRISRAQVMQALAVFTQIINAGITIITLADEMVYSPEKLASDPMPLMMSIMVMIRAHEESATKSKRLKAAWSRKRKDIGEKKLTRTCPSWMELNADRTKFELIPANVKIVKRILQMQREGIGQSSIVRTLNKEGVRPIQTRVPTQSWHQSTIQKFITNPALYGAYQPTTGAGRKKRVPYGDPIEGYYPSIITKEEFLLLQQARHDRLSRGRGAKGKEFANLFSGLLRCGYCQGTMTVGGHSHEGKPIKRYIVCSNAKRGLDCHFVMWSYHLFEKTVLAFCDELDFSTLLDDTGHAKGLVTSQTEVVDALRAKQQEQRERLGRLIAAIEEGDAPAAILDRIRDGESRLANIENEIIAEERKLAEFRSLRQDAAEIKSSIIDLFKQFEKKKGDELYILRAKVAAQLRRVIQEIHVWPGGIIMDPVTWREFAADLDQAYVDQARLKDMMLPNKKMRFAIIIGRNGKSFATYAPFDARLKGLMDKAQLLERLGIAH